MNNYGNSGVESRHASAAELTASGLRASSGGAVRLGTPAISGRRDSRSSALPVPTLYGGQPDGAHIASAGRHYEYAEMMDGRFPSDDMEYIEA